MEHGPYELQPILTSLGPRFFRMDIGFYMGGLHNGLVLTSLQRICLYQKG